MGGFDASVAALQATGARLQEIASDTRDDFGPVQAEMDSLLGGGWSGGSAQGFRSGWEQWLDGFRSCLTALDEMGQLLNRTGSGYGAADETSQAGVTQSGAGLT